MAMQSISVHRVRAALRGAQRLGLDTAPLLQRARIPPLLVGNDCGRVTPDQFTRLIRVLFHATDDEFLGLGRVPSRRGTFAMMCCASLSCRDLGAALDRAVRFYGLFPGGPDLAVTTADVGGEARFTVRSRLGDDPDHFLAECLLVIWHRLSNWLIGHRIPLLRADFAYPPPPHREEYEALFGCPVRFGAPRTGAAFDAHWLTAPVVRDEHELDELLRRAPADLLSRRSYDTTVAEQVRSALARPLRADAATSRLPQAAEVAARLAVSPATLRRRLLKEGTSFQRLKDQARQEAAIAGLVEGREPIAELAARLGFSEDTAFLRAFRRWTGTTPGAFRGAYGAGAIQDQRS
ncbi:AraC family transcriptional regulator ligand-binding domain-containing protein [Streptomyces sp. RB6PN25]|uniref:AraC family transcriptional regulator ligand-binding domain-containing protein n=1 Tax=Streptomyces humicola TaxID=2953240 RepID=A0ABT1PW62_9ACTN|nr:AraC family transcriptional regulator ligand-binding domain-containing protein [Streptomyces humicola]MCQ4081250.1 AraC family transcriptional regulator ligand-binding domain-containing protein [Streptomyces humicola]